jgi:hypothetical protein
MIISITYVDDVIWLTLVRASNNHHALDKGSFLFVVQNDVFSLKSMNGIVYDSNSTIYNKFTSVNLWLGLLDLEERLGNLGVVSDFGQIHALDFNSGNLASSVEHFFQEFRNEHSVIL